MMRGTLQAAALALSLALVATGWAQGYHPGDAVRVNDRTISYQRFTGFYTEYRNSKGVSVGARGDQLPLLSRYREEAMELLIDQELVAQAAERAGIQADPAEVDANLAKMREVFPTELNYASRLETEGFTPESYRAHLERMAAATHYLDNIRNAAPEVTDEMLEAYYRDNQRRLLMPERVRVSHILLSWKPLGTPDDRAALYEQINGLLERARAGEDFAALAREYSEDRATRDNGGDVGLFRRGEMVPAFEAVAFALQPGEISDPVSTPFGLHILRGEEHRAAQVLPLDEVREMLRQHIRSEQAEQAVEVEKARLRAAADIQVLIPLGNQTSRAGE
jgi:peptidyl-prolyl cis-trans isomerase C